MKAPAAKLCQFNEDITLAQFRKFKMDWGVFKRITNLPENQIHAQLYNACSESVQNSLVNTKSDFFFLTEEKMIETPEKIVTKKMQSKGPLATFLIYPPSTGRINQRFCC